MRVALAIIVLRAYPKTAVAGLPTEPLTRPKVSQSRARPSVTQNSGGSVMLHCAPGPSPEPWPKPSQTPLGPQSSEIGTSATRTGGLHGGTVQSPSAVQTSPSPWQLTAPQLPSTHSSEQQSAGLVQASPFGTQVVVWF